MVDSDSPEASRAVLDGAATGTGKKRGETF